MQTPLLLAILVFCCSSVLAQPGVDAPDSSGARAPGDSIVLRPVVVTATRLVEPLVRAPYAVSVVERSGPTPGMSLAEALRGVPGLQVDNRSNFAVGDRLVVRGMGARSQFGVRGVKVLVDGIPATFADGQSALDAIDPRFVERAEVIRGAASMLYGNAAGGAILMSTEGRPGSRVGASYVGGGGPVTAYARSEFPIGEGAIRYLGSQIVYDGWREHSDATVSRHLLGARLRVGDDTLRLRASFAKLDANNPGSLTLALVNSAPTVANRSNVTQETGKKLTQAELGASFTSSGDIAVDAGVWGIVRNVDNPIVGRIVLLDRIATGARIAVTGGAPDAWLRWTLGADLDAQLDDRSNLEFPRSSNHVVLDQDETVLSVGPYGVASIALTPELALTAAVRGDIVRFHVEDHLVDSLDPDDSGDRTMQALSPSLGVAWSPNEQLAANASDASGGFTLFANVATGFETPTTTELANRPSGAGGFNPDLEPQRSLSFELGARAHIYLPSHSLGPVTIEVVGYFMTIDDELIPFELDDAPGRSYFRNAGSARHFGVEEAVTFTDFLAPGLDLRASLTSTSARFRDFTVDSVSYAGNRVPGVARWFETIDIDYRAGDFRLGLRARFLDSMAVDDANTAATDPAFTFGFDASFEGLRFDIAGSPVTLVPWVAVENIFDADYIASVVPNAAGGRFYEPGRGRAFAGGIEVRLR